MDVSLVVRSLGGIAHRAAVYEAGLHRAAVRAAIDAGRLLRVRRDWVAVPDCAPGLRRAVAIGGRLSCLSAAQHLGLWVIDDERFHIAVAPTASRLRLTPPPEGGVAPELVHWAEPVVSVTPRIAIDPLENVLITVAACQPHENAVVVIDSALNKGLVRRPQLMRLASRVVAHSRRPSRNPMPGPTAASRPCHDCAWRGAGCGWNRRWSSTVTRSMDSSASAWCSSSTAIGSIHS